MSIRQVKSLYPYGFQGVTLVGEYSTLEQAKQVGKLHGKTDQVLILHHRQMPNYQVYIVNK